MEKIISDLKFNSILVKSYIDSSHGQDFSEDHFYGLLEKNINDELPQGMMVMDLEIVKRSITKWSVIISLSNDDELLYSVNTKTFLKNNE